MLTHPVPPGDMSRLLIVSRSIRAVGTSCYIFTAIHYLPSMQCVLLNRMSNFSKAVSQLSVHKVGHCQWGTVTTYIHWGTVLCLSIYMYCNFILLHYKRDMLYFLMMALVPLMIQINYTKYNQQIHKYV